MKARTGFFGFGKSGVYYGRPAAVERFVSAFFTDPVEFWKQFDPIFETAKLDKKAIVLVWGAKGLKRVAAVSFDEAVKIEKEFYSK